MSTSSEQSSPVGLRTGYSFIASPYTHPDKVVMDQRFLEAVELCAWLTNQLYAVYSPIVSWHQTANLHELPKDHHFWKENSRQFLMNAQRLIILCIPGWQESQGVAFEALFAVSLSKPIYLIHKLGKNDYSVAKQHEDLPD